MKIGYVRVSTEEQNTSRQEVMMQELGVEEMFVDRMSGKNKNRPELQRMLSFVRRGDTVVVESISRFARNTRDLLELTDQLDKAGVEFVSKKESIDTSTPCGRFMLTVFGAIAELERESIRERQAEGIALAKERGVYKGRKPIEVDDADFAREYAIWKSGNCTARTAMARLGLKPNTFYRRVKEYEENK